jgi:uncharacterized protein YodC (DUF2158 family)
MAFEPGNVVVLKSGGQPMTVAAVDEDSVECLWLGEDGELFRETIPSVVLTVIPDALDDDDLDVEDDDDDEEAEHDATGHEDTDADDGKPSKSKRRSA